MAVAEHVLSGESIDIAIVDMESVGDSGVDVLQSLRQASPSTAFVALGSALERDDESALYLAGAQEIIRRPLTRATNISAALRRAIVRRESTRHESQSGGLAPAIGLIVHDLINPLTTIEMCAAALVPPDAARQQRMADLIKQSASLMHHAIRDLSDRADLELNRLQLERQLLDVHEILDSVQESISTIAAQRRVPLVMRYDDALPVVLADRDRIVRSIAHIIRAALALARPGERVELSVRGMHHQAIPPSGGPPGRAVEFSVRHTGSGAAMNDTVQRSDAGPHSTAVMRGTGGLGLSIAKSLIEAHGGSMDITIAAGHATQFSFSLPALGSRTGQEAS
jgi:signal transduction histidine kinase